MIVRIQRSTVEKVLECHGYVRTRWAFKENEDETQVRVDLELGQSPPDGFQAVSSFEFRSQSSFGSFNIPEEEGNFVFVMDEEWTTRERYHWS